jgi:hypothetical protein
VSHGEDHDNSYLSRVALESIADSLERIAVALERTSPAALECSTSLPKLRSGECGSVGSQGRCERLEGHSGHHTNGFLAWPKETST